MKILLIISRILGFIVAFFFLFIATSELLVTIRNSSMAESIVWKDYIFFEIVFIASMAYVLSWRHEGLGGLVMTLSGVAISYFNDWKLGLPYFIVGQFYVLYWFLKSSGTKTKKPVKTNSQA